MSPSGDTCLLDLYLILLQAFVHFGSIHSLFQY